MKVGSLCSGYGGLDLAVESIFDGKCIWHSEIDPHASKVLAAHWPDSPNLGDLTLIDWCVVEPVDIFCAGFPCQPVSQAGKGLGIVDERWIIHDIFKGIRALQPSLVILENVRGLLTANKGEAFAQVLNGLAYLGYVCRWGCVRASEAGAPHRRERIFIVAHPHGNRCEGRSEFNCEEISEEDRQRRDDTFRCGVHMGEWGQYAPAIARWSEVIGRPAPSGLRDGRLSPVFVEWMMGLPEGWVTDIIPTKTHSLRILGNGVVPQQADLAIRCLL